MITTFIAALLAQAIDSKIAAGIIESSDPRKDQVMLLSVPQEDSISLDKIVVFFGGMRIKDDIQYRIYLRNTPKPTRFGVQKLRLERCKNVSWQLNGQPIKLGQVDYDFSRSASGLMSERIVQHLNIGQLKAIGTASTVTYKLCDIEGSIDIRELQKAKVIAQRLSGEE